MISGLEPTLCVCLCVACGISTEARPLPYCTGTALPPAHPKMCEQDLAIKQLRILHLLAPKPLECVPNLLPASSHCTCDAICVAGCECRSPVPLALEPTVPTISFAYRCQTKDLAMGSSERSYLTINCDCVIFNTPTPLVFGQWVWKLCTFWNIECEGWIIGLIIGTND